MVATPSPKNLHVGRVKRLLRPPDGDEEAAADEGVLLRFPLARLPALLVRASQEVLPDFALEERRQIVTKTSLRNLEIDRL